MLAGPKGSVILHKLQGDRDYEQLVDYMLNIKKGRHYFNPTFF